MFTDNLLEKTTKYYSYEEYKKLITLLLEQKKVTGAEQSTDKLEATTINLQRIKRLDKTIILSPKHKHGIMLIKRSLDLYLLSEGWCGDSAQITPVIVKIAQLNPKITLRILLRDDNPKIMDTYLTNGGRAIPKLICIDRENGTELGTWGPRPRLIQEMVKSYKKENPNTEHSEFVKNLHLWYAKDKTKAIQDDIMSELFKWAKH